MRSDNKGRDIFYGIVAVATLIVAIIGATLAYFSVTASSNEGAINAQAATVSIAYNDGQQVTAQADELIPATPTVVKQVYESRVKGQEVSENIEDNLCIDKNNRQVCSVYRFTVETDMERAITAMLNNEHNGFTYLSYAVYDVTKGEWLTLNTKPVAEGEMSHESLFKCSNENDDPEDDCFEDDPKIYSTKNKALNSIFGYELNETGDSEVNKSYTIVDGIQEFELVLFLKESGGVQNMDQGKKYSGTIYIEVDGGQNGTGNITGVVD